MPVAGPLEAVVNNLTREIQGKGEEGRELQRRWVGWQTELVELQAENNRLAQDLQRLKATHTITHHKRTRLRQQYAPLRPPVVVIIHLCVYVCVVCVCVCVCVRVCVCVYVLPGLSRRLSTMHPSLCSDFVVQKAASEPCLVFVYSHSEAACRRFMLCSHLRLGPGAA